MTTARFHPLRPGTRIPGDWYDGEIPSNIEVGEGSQIDSAASFKRYSAMGRCGLRVGSDTTIWRTSLSPEREGFIEIGDHCYIADAVLVCAERIKIGNDVLLAAGVTIVDSDFHPIGIEERIVDSVALSPHGDPSGRPSYDVRPVTIGDRVRVGFNATILKGVTVGDNAIIAPGAVVSRDVPPGAYVFGNPAREANREDLE